MWNVTGVKQCLLLEFVINVIIALILTFVKSVLSPTQSRKKSWRLHIRHHIKLTILFRDCSHKTAIHKTSLVIKVEHIYPMFCQRIVILSQSQPQVLLLKEAVQEDHLNFQNNRLEQLYLIEMKFTHQLEKTLKMVWRQM